MRLPFVIARARTPLTLPRLSPLWLVIGSSAVDLVIGVIHVGSDEFCRPLILRGRVLLERSGGQRAAGEPPRGGGVRGDRLISSTFQIRPRSS